MFTSSCGAKWRFVTAAFVLPLALSALAEPPTVIPPGQARLERIMRWLKSEDATVRLSALQELGQIRSPEAIPLIISATRDPQGSVRATAARLLKYRNDPRVVEPLRALLTDENDDVRGQATWAISYVGGRAVLPDILRLAREDVSGVVRFRAVWGLGIIGDNSALPAAIAALEDMNPSVRERGALLAIEALRDETLLTRLREKVDDPRPGTRRVVMYLLGKYGDASVLDLLREKLNDSHALIRGEAALALGRLKEKAARVALQQALADEDEHVRGSAAFALGLIGDHAAEQALRAVLADESAFVRAVAAEALQKLGATDVKPPDGFAAAELFTYPIYSSGFNERDE